MLAPDSSLGLQLVPGHAGSPGELHRDLLVLDTRGAQQQDAGAGRVRDAVTEQFQRHYLVTETIMTNYEQLDRYKAKKIKLQDEIDMRYLKLFHNNLSDMFVYK